MSGLAAIEALLRRRIGLDPQSVGSANVAQAVRLRLRAREELEPGEAELSEALLARYATRLAGDGGEFDALVESVVVRNSWLFREVAAFEALVGYAAECRAAPLRVLSLGCASGEEPVSLAVWLLAAGRASSSFEIDAVDISATALEQARRGRFAAGELSAEQRALRDRFFGGDGASETFVAHPEVRSALRFIRGNAVDPELLAGGASYHVVFCRNLLIYFDQTARQRTLENIGRLLEPGGLLAVGAAEAGRLARPEGAAPLRLERFGEAGSAAFRVLARRPELAAAPSSPTSHAIAKEEERPAGEGPAEGALSQAPSEAPATTPRPERRRGPTSGLLSVFGGQAFGGCWQEIGVLGGDGSCAELQTHVTCLGCPVYREHGRRLLDRPAPPGYTAEQAAVVAEPKDDGVGETWSLTVFRLAREWFALATDQILLVAPVARVHTMPFRSGQVLRGITNINGAIHLCVTLHGLLQLEVAEREALARRPRMVVIGSDDNNWVFEADEVDSVTRCPADAPRPPPANVGGSNQRTMFTRGVVPLDGRQVGLLDGELIVAGLKRAVL